MQGLGARALPVCVFVCVCVLCVLLVGGECVSKKKKVRGVEEGGEEGSVCVSVGVGVKGEDGEDEVSYAGTEAGHLSVSSWMTPGNPYILPIGV